MLWANILELEFYINAKFFDHLVCAFFLQILIVPLRNMILWRYVSFIYLLISNGSSLAWSFCSCYVFSFVFLSLSKFQVKRKSFLQFSTQTPSSFDFCCSYGCLLIFQRRVGCWKSMIQLYLYKLIFLILTSGDFSVEWNNQQEEGTKMG